MGANEIGQERFPVLPAFKATWCPLYWEPIEHSGERITFAVLSKSADAVQIHSVLRPSAIRHLFPKKHAGIRGFFELVADSLHAHLADAKPPSTWRPPITGIHFGKWREAVSDSLPGVLAQAVAQVSSLSWPDAAFYQEYGPKDEAQQQPMRKRLADQIKDYVAEKQVDLVRFFDGEGRLVDDGVPVRFGFVSPKLVAHFGVLRPSDIGRSYKDARGRLWELQKAAQRAGFGHASLILHVPDPTDVLFEESQIQTAQTAFEELRLEAEEDNVDVLSVHSPREAGEKILKLAA